MSGEEEGSDSVDVRAFLVEVHRRLSDRRLELGQIKAAANLHQFAQIGRRSRRIQSTRAVAIPHNALRQRKMA